MAELVIFIGLQASGKSSFYRARFSDTHTWVSRDHFPKARNRNTRIARMITAALEGGRNVVVDNTNPTMAERAGLIHVGRQYGAEIVGYYFQSKASDCIERNEVRDDKSRVPKVAIYDTAKRMQIPSVTEGFDRLYYVRLAPGGGFDVCEWIGDEDA